MKMRFVLFGFFAAGILVVGFPNRAAAACRWTWDCSQGYPCQQVQVCDNTLDLPALRPPEIPPIPPPTIRPIPKPTIPPIGTSQCQPQYLCDSWGNCRWETVCR